VALNKHGVQSNLSLGYANQRRRVDDGRRLGYELASLGNSYPSLPSLISFSAISENSIHTLSA